ncbi:hypothetical protein [Acinetobacter sp. P1(2025)]|uniref:hypothetical protein n=1 Tax=Acinetobacter sp. P1(2025) TaxID=3446120 RepID=UPI003F529EEF
MARFFLPEIPVARAPKTIRLRSARPRYRLAMNSDFKALAPTLAFDGASFNIGYSNKCLNLIGKTLKIIHTFL